MSLKDRILLRFRALKKELLAVYYAYQDPRMGFFPKLLAFITIAYALSPIDLIPDFIPILGLLDDVLILPVLIAVTIKSIPKEIFHDAQEKSKTEIKNLKTKWFFVPLFISIWIIALVLIARGILSLFQ